MDSIAGLCAAAPRARWTMRPARWRRRSTARWAASPGEAGGGQAHGGNLPSATLRGPAPNRVTLPPLLKRLHAAGIPVEGVTILIATGLHRAATKEELDVIRRAGDRCEVSRRQPRRTQLCGAPVAGDNAGAGRRCISTSGSWQRICTSRSALLSRT